jgi:hypothetical protein
MKDLIIKSEELGKQANIDGLGSAPVLNSSFNDWVLSHEKHEIRVSMLRAYLQGWIKQNLKEKVA